MQTFSERVDMLMVHRNKGEYCDEERNKKKAREGALDELKDGTCQTL